MRQAPEHPSATAAQAARKAPSKVAKDAGSQAEESVYPSRIGKVKIGVWLPEQQVELMKLWCLMHKTPMQEIIAQAVAEWWEKQPVELARPVENVLKTNQGAQKKRAKQ
jgi:hypothetical protein